VETKTNEKGNDMKIEDLEIFIETTLQNVKREIWTVEKGKEFICEKINLLFQEFNDKLGEVK